MSLKIGDWITSYYAGIWQIYRILEYNDIDPMTKKIIKRTTIFSKRFINNSFKKSFSESCCDPVWANKLDKNMKRNLEIFIKDNDKLFEKFNSYIPKELDSIYNSRIGIPKNKTIDEIEKKIFTNNEFTIKEINPYLNSLGFNTEELPSWTAQFVSRNFTCQSNWLKYKFVCVLDF